MVRVCQACGVSAGGGGMGRGVKPKMGMHAKIALCRGGSKTKTKTKKCNDSTVLQPFKDAGSLQFWSGANSVGVSVPALFRAGGHELSWWMLQTRQE